RTDADHITEWDTGGETNPENLQLLCRKHHNLKTHHGWQAKVLDPETNTIQWTSPLCNTYLTEPVGTGTGTGTSTGVGSGSGSGRGLGAQTGAGDGTRTGVGVDPWGTPRDNDSDSNNSGSAGARSNSNYAAQDDSSNPAPWTFSAQTFTAQQNTDAANGPCFKCLRHECSTPGHDNRIGPFNDHSVSYQNSLAEGFRPIQGPHNKPASTPQHFTATGVDDNPPF
uniref:HNH endonuclease signature motif containing protein n=1 Tax=Haematomicrobium sanguinis TaxID=479106 RepID=UPI000479E222